MSNKNNQQLAENQVFVRNLPYDVNEEDLTKLFEEVGPLKNVSIAKDSNGSSRGFGFVKFALEDDAKAALTKLQDQKVKGRQIKLELGLKKENDPKKRKRDAAESAAAPVSFPIAAAATTKPQQQQQQQKTLKLPANNKKTAATVATSTTPAVEPAAAAEETADSISRGRQVLVFGIPLDVNKKIFSRVLDKIVRKVKVEFVTEGHAVSESALITYPGGKIILLTCNSRPDATKIVEMLNKETIGNLGFGKFNFGDEKNEKEAADEDENNEDAAVTEMFKTKNMLKQRLIARLHSEVTPLTHRKKRCRLIIRNLSFQARDIHIMDRMKRFGPIVDIDLPITILEKPLKKRVKPGSVEEKEEDGDKKTMKQVETHRGFAFITFLCESDAKTAAEQSNVAGKILKICNREVAVDHCYSKDTYLKFGNNPPTGAEGEETNDEEKVEEEKKDVKDNKKKNDSSKMDVDEESGSDNDDDEEDDEEEDEDNSDNDSGSLEEDNGSDLDMSDDENDDDEENEGEEGKVDKNEYVSNLKNQRLIGGDVNEGRTLFLRNLAYDMTSDDIKNVLQRYGRVELALIVKDKATGTSKGSAFVKFGDSQSAERCLKECEDAGIEIKHKNVKVTRAIDRDSAEKIKQGQKPGKDKRNLYLANEGLALDGENTVKMNEFDREKRTRAQADKKKKLQNPLFFVSHERLSIRNVAKNIKDHDLKIMCLKATKAGLTKGLVTIQDMQNLQLAQGPELFDPESAANASANSFSNANNNPSSSTVKLRSINDYSLQDLRSLPTFDSKTCIRSAKVILDLDRVSKSTPSTGADANKSSAAPSRGYAFVEFSHHAFALACLRELNNNAAYENMALQLPVSNKDKENKDSNKNIKTRLITEFSLENIRKVKILKDRQSRVEQRREEQRALRNVSQDDKLAKKKAKRKLQREQKRQRENTDNNKTEKDSADGVVVSPLAEKDENNNKKRKREENNTINNNSNKNNNNNNNVVEEEAEGPENKKKKQVSILTPTDATPTTTTTVANKKKAAKK